MCTMHIYMWAVPIAKAGKTGRQYPTWGQFVGAQHEQTDQYFNSLTLVAVSVLAMTAALLGWMYQPTLAHADPLPKTNFDDSAMPEHDATLSSCSEGPCDELLGCDEYLTGTITAAEFNERYPSVQDRDNDGEHTICLGAATIQRTPSESSGVTINTFYSIHIRGVGSEPSVFEDNTSYNAILKFTESGGSVENVRFVSAGEFVTAVELRKSFVSKVRNVSMDLRGRGLGLRLLDQSTLQSLEQVHVRTVTDGPATAIQLWDSSRIDSIAGVSLSGSSAKNRALSLFSQSSIGTIQDFSGVSGSVGIDVGLYQRSSIDSVSQSQFGIVQIDESKVGLMRDSQVGKILMDKDAYLTNLTSTTLGGINLYQRSAIGAVNDCLIRGGTPGATPIFIQDGRLSVMRRSTIECAAPSGNAIFVHSTLGTEPLIDLLYAVQIVGCDSSPIYNQNLIDEMRDVQIN